MESDLELYRAVIGVWIYIVCGCLGVAWWVSRSWKD